MIIFRCILTHTKFTECRTLLPHQIYFSYKLSEKTKFALNKTACQCAYLWKEFFYKHQNKIYTCDMLDVKYGSMQINFVMTHLASVQSAVKRSPCVTMSDDSHKNYYKHQK